MKYKIRSTLNFIPLIVWLQVYHLKMGIILKSCACFVLYVIKISIAFDILFVFMVFIMFILNSLFFTSEWLHNFWFWKLTLHLLQQVRMLVSPRFFKLKWPFCHPLIKLPSKGNQFSLMPMYSLEREAEMYQVKAHWLNFCWPDRHFVPLPSVPFLFTTFLAALLPVTGGCCNCH